METAREETPSLRLATISRASLISCFRVQTTQDRRMVSRSLAVGALSLFVVFTGCRALDAPMISELPSPAPNAPQCAGSTLAMAPSDAKGGTPVVPKNNNAPAGSFGVVFQTRSKADPTARSVDIVRPDGSGLKEIVSGFFDAEKPVVAPNRRLVAYEIDRGGLSRPELHVLDVSGLNDHKLYKADRYRSEERRVGKECRSR